MVVYSIVNISAVQMPNTFHLTYLINNNITYWSNCNYLANSRMVYNTDMAKRHMCCSTYKPGMTHLFSTYKRVNTLWLSMNEYNLSVHMASGISQTWDVAAPSIPSLSAQPSLWETLWVATLSVARHRPSSLLQCCAVFPVRMWHIFAVTDTVAWRRNRLFLKQFNKDYGQGYCVQTTVLFVI